MLESKHHAGKYHRSSKPQRKRQSPKIMNQESAKQNLFTNPRRKANQSKPPPLLARDRQKKCQSVQALAQRSAHFFVPSRQNRRQHRPNHESRQQPPEKRAVPGLPRHPPRFSRRRMNREKIPPSHRRHRQ